MDAAPTTTNCESPPAARIVCTPGTCGGRPRVEGTRIRVQDVYFWHEVEGKCPEEIVREFPQLTMADIYTALSYFWSHRVEILSDIDQQRQNYQTMKQSQPSLLAEKLPSLAPEHAADDSVSPGRTG